MPVPLVPVAAAAAILALRSDSQPQKVFVEKPRGTLYWGGAGLNGNYIAPTLAALRAAGISEVNVGLTNTATTMFSELGTYIDALRAGLLIRYEEDDEWTISSGMGRTAHQFNLIGYSYGSLLAAQTANYYAKQGHVVDHLVLIGSPIDASFLQLLRNRTAIRKVVVIDLTAKGDPIHAGISQAELVMAAPKLGQQMMRWKGEGHFYYAHVVADSNSRWADLAQRLHAEGLR